MLNVLPYIETNSYSITQYEHYIKISWKAKVVSEQIKEGLHHLYRLMQSSEQRRILSDVRLCESSWTSSNEWIVQHWLPEVLHLGLQRVAFLISNNLVIHRVSVDNLLVKLQRKQRFVNRFFKVFSQEADAILWLES